MIVPDSLCENALFRQGFSRVIAIDEVGVGCLAGPVVVCAVLIDKNILIKLSDIKNIRDSKLLSAKQRETIALKLRGVNLKHCIALSYPKTIDKINIYRATRVAMRRAVTKLKVKKHQSKTMVLIDGATKIHGLDLPQLPIVHGDRTVLSIACASILAKVYRDALMIRYARKYPDYGLEKHKGYGTQLHYANLAKHGPSFIHRQSFTLKT